MKSSSLPCGGSTGEHEPSSRGIGLRNPRQWKQVTIPPGLSIQTRERSGKARDTSLGWYVENSVAADLISVIELGQCQAPGLVEAVFLGFLRHRGCGGGGDGPFGVDLVRWAVAHR